MPVPGEIIAEWFKVSKRCFSFFEQFYFLPSWATAVNVIVIQQ